ncbi:hypothetical protein [Erysipelatoclostridium sp. An15]|uniref:hypothetical protein n=1 Tax=Erysipelatoclostridium sp. An15 TaxID=1965566 RepID=UPI0019522B86|nr:hypothetical protein [Erysipelatoclostridium sp. An15]
MKQAVGYARYHIRADRSATGKVATCQLFSIKDSLKNGCPFPLQRKELKRIEED